jgi:hypothetical protein
VRNMNLLIVELYWLARFIILPVSSLLVSSLLIAHLFHDDYVD